MNMSSVCIDSKLMTDDKNDAMFCLGKVLFASVATKRRARASTGLREKVSRYGLARGTVSTAPLADMNYMKC